jgi:hypothetical protein
MVIYPGTQPPIQLVPGALSLGLKRPRREADHSPPSSSEVKEWVELYLHSPIRLHGVVLSWNTGTTLPLPCLRTTSWKSIGDVEVKLRILRLSISWRWVSFMLRLIYPQHPLSRTLSVPRSCWCAGAGNILVLVPVHKRVLSCRDRCCQLERCFHSWECWNRVFSPFVNPNCFSMNRGLLYINILSFIFTTVFFPLQAVDTFHFITLSHSEEGKWE